MYASPRHRVGVPMCQWGRRAKALDCRASKCSNLVVRDASSFWNFLFCSFGSWPQLILLVFCALVSVSIQTLPLPVGTQTLAVISFYTFFFDLGANAFAGCCATRNNQSINFFNLSSSTVSDLKLCCVLSRCYLPGRFRNSVKRVFNPTKFRG